jgi:hypothetical protein
MGQRVEEVAMSSGAEHVDQPSSVRRRHESLVEQVRRRGLRPVTSLDDVTPDDVFESAGGARRVPRLVSR